MAEYIEREALLKWALDSMDAQRDVVGKAYCAEFVRAIRQFKAADVAPVVHGRWIETEQENGCATWTEFRCSVCGAIFDGDEWLFDEWKGCPVCLTRMDGAE